MTITDFLEGTTGFISNIADTIIFWSDWSGFAQKLLLIVCVLLFIGYMMLKQKMQQTQRGMHGRGR